MSIYVKQDNGTNDLGRNYDQDIHNLYNYKQDSLSRGQASVADFNAIQGIGYHWINPNVTHQNHPYPGTWSILEYLANGYQRFYTYESNGNLQSAVRTFTNDAWTPWALSACQNVKSVAIATARNVTLKTSGTDLVVNYNVPRYPIAIVPMIHGGVPAYISVNSWSNTQAHIFIRSASDASNRTIQLMIVY